MQLIDQSDRYRSLGLNVVGISYDDPSENKEFTVDNDLNFQMVSDQGTQTFSNLGVLNEGPDKDHFAYGIPHPGILLVDSNGVIQVKRAKEKYQERPDWNELFEAVSAAIGS